MAAVNTPIIYQEAPNIKALKKFSKIQNVYGDIPLINADIALRDILIPDPDYSFFKTYLQEGPAELQAELTEAVTFYAQRFGIDLNKFAKTSDYWISGEHRFYPYVKQGDYTATQLACNCCMLTDYSYIEGGFVLVVGAPGINARGTYGKMEGEHITPGSLIFFGYYILVDENNRGSIYHFRSVNPSISSSNAPLRWNLDVYDYREKLWGKSIGSTIVDKKEMIVSRPTITSNTSYVPTTVPVNVPSGVRQTSTAVTRTVGTVGTAVQGVNRPAFPLTATPVRVVPGSTSSTVLYPGQQTVINSTVNVPTVAPVIREEITGVEEERGTTAMLITRSIVTFGFNVCQ